MLIFSSNSKSKDKKFEYGFISNMYERLAYKQTGI